ncbi:hypothetical protein GOP47_0020239 [Adiantum capillus-veneris]|uniref:Uncharacterized protein n=1 Tax=Adiantum capillus-veneris TaxID=13818 RepID=A0A9D4Z8H2_ADICA|nr:hypothetical protein GOP47_0020239 [Adiantum capillus-veneris]
MAHSLRRVCKTLHLAHGEETKKLFELGPVSVQTALYAKASQDEVVKKKKKKKKEKKKEKKGAAGADEYEKDRARFSDLVAKALNAPSAVRHVSQKERLREQEMAKYGLMTKERQIELEQIKAREKAKKQNQEGEEATFVEEDEEKRRLKKEEGMRLAKEYSRFLMREDRKLHAGETIRLRLKNEAIAALPPGLQEAARVPDMTPFPGISPATLTPPIPGFSYDYSSGKVEDEI